MTVVPFGASFCGISVVTAVEGPRKGPLAYLGPQKPAQRKSPRKAHRRSAAERPGIGAGHSVGKIGNRLVEGAGPSLGRLYINKINTL